jgi:predicted Fe-Mo cluster-binding NifX family protein
MRVAVTIWEGRISPVFDVSREARILTVENGTVTSRLVERIDAPDKIARMSELDVDTVICGAISAPLHAQLTARGVRVIGFVAGDVDEVVRAFLADDLPARALSMPGCCRRHNRFRGGRRTGGCGRGTRRGQ